MVAYARDIHAVRVAGRVMELVDDGGREVEGRITRLLLLHPRLDLGEQRVRVLAHRAGRDRGVAREDVVGIVATRGGKAVLGDPARDVLQLLDRRRHRVGLAGRDRQRLEEALLAGRRQGGVDAHGQRIDRAKHDLQELRLGHDPERLGSPGEPVRDRVLGPVEDAGGGRAGLHGNVGRGPSEQGECVVGRGPPVEASVVAGGPEDLERRLVGRRPSPADRHLLAERRHAEGPAVGRGRDDPLQPLADVNQCWPSIVPEARQWRRAGCGREGQRAEDRDRDEHRAAAQVERADRRRVADPPADPGRPLVEGMEAGQQEQPGHREEHEEPHLVVGGRRHVGDEDRAEHDDRPDRPSLAEDARGGELAIGPAHQAEDEQVMAGLARHRQAADSEVEGRVKHRSGRGLVAGRERTRGIENRADDDRDDQRREGGPDEVSDRPAPARPSTDEPRRDPSE